VVVPSNVFHGLSSELHPKFVTGLPFVKMLFTRQPVVGRAAVGVAVVGDKDGDCVGFDDGLNVGLMLGGRGNIMPGISISAHCT